MRCEFDRHVLTQAVVLCESFTDPSANKRVLGYIKFAIEPDRATLSAFNFESQVEHNINVSADGSCTFMLEAKILSKLLKQCDADTIIFVTSSPDGVDSVTVLNHTDEFQLRVLDDDLPSLPTINSSYIAMPNSLLARGKTLLVSTDEESGRYALSGVCFDFGNEVLNTISTDGRRLSRYCTSVRTSMERSIIVPSSLFAKLSKLTNVQMRANDNMIEFAAAQTRISGRLMEGRFPNWRKVYEWDHSPIAKRTIDRAALLSAMRRTMLVTDSDNHGIQVEITGRSMILKAASASVGKSSVQLDCDGMQGEEHIEVTLDGNYILEPLATATGDTVELWWDSPSSAVVFDFDGVQYVLMPMNR